MATTTDTIESGLIHRTNVAAMREAIEIANNRNRIEARAGEWDASIRREANGWRAVAEFWATEIEIDAPTIEQCDEVSRSYPGPLTVEWQPDMKQPHTLSMRLVRVGRLFVYVASQPGKVIPILPMRIVSIHQPDMPSNNLIDDL